MNHKDVKDTFSDDVAKNWEDKSSYINSILGNKIKISNIFRDYVEDGYKILEVGCGTGKNLKFLDNNYLLDLLCGIDISEDMLSNIRSDFRNKIIILCNDFMKTRMTEKFDVIIVQQVIHHVVNKQAFLDKIKTFLCDDGIIILKYPNEKYFAEIVSYQHSYDILGRITHKEMNNILSKLELEVIKTREENLIYNFKEYHKLLKFIYSIGSFQKICNYEITNEQSLRIIDFLKAPLKEVKDINVSASYTYLIIRKDKWDEKI